MKLSLEPGELPFKVGDRIFVNQPYSTMVNQKILTDNKPYFEAEIVRIFLEFPNTVSIISERREVHNFAVTVITYDLKPVGFYQNESRVTVRIDLTAEKNFLFATKDKLLKEQ